MNSKEFFKGLAAMGVSLVIFLVLLEITLQIYTRLFIYYDVEMSRYATEVKQKADNPKIGHVHEPNAEAYLMGVDVSINSDGFRDDEYPVERTDKYRILVLGDSLTFGWGVEHEETYVQLLEERLNAELRPTEMINTGHGNYNTSQQVNLLRDKGLKYNPDKVVVFFFINDAEVTPQRSKWTPVARLRSVTFLWSRIRGLLTRAAPGQTFESFYTALYEDDFEGFIAMKDAFLELQGITEERGIELQVIMIPELHDLVNYPFSEAYGKVYGFLAENGIPVIDLTSDFAGYEDAEGLWVAPDDAHPNALGHSMIAEYSYPFIATGRAN